MRRPHHLLPAMPRSCDLSLGAGSACPRWPDLLRVHESKPNNPPYLGRALHWAKASRQQLIDNMLIMNFIPRYGRPVTPTGAGQGGSGPKLAEEEGFEPPVSLRPRLISSQVP